MSDIDDDLDDLYPPIGEDAMRLRIDALASRLSETTERNNFLEKRFEMLKALYFELLFETKA